MAHDNIKTIPAAIDFFLEMLQQHPERDALAAYEAALAGRRRKYPCFALEHLVSPDDTDLIEDDFKLPSVTASQTPEGDFIRKIVGMLIPLKMLNPVTPMFGLGMGPGTLVTGFGIPLDPKAQNCPAFNKSLDQILAEPPPDPTTSGMFPALRAQIDLIKQHTPPTFKIGLPDMQGPFNLVHNTIGNEAFTAPYDDETKFHAIMERMTTYWIASRKNLFSWIGEERISPTERAARICECSVNLVSPEFYTRFVLEHDRRIAEAFGLLHIHPCSGPHVFRVTLNNLPVMATEAGFVAKAAAGSISVDDALRAINGRPILLCIGQEPPENREFEFIRADFDRYQEHPHMLFNYTGMHWRRKNRPGIRELHRRLDDYWERKYASG